MDAVFPYSVRGGGRRTHGEGGLLCRTSSSVGWGREGREMHFRAKVRGTFYVQGHVSQRWVPGQCWGACSSPFLFSPSLLPLTREQVRSYFCCPLGPHTHPGSSALVISLFRAGLAYERALLVCRVSSGFQGPLLRMPP